MKKKIIENGDIAYVHNYKDYNIVIYLNEEKLTNFAIISPDGVNISTGSIYDEKNPDGIPNTTHYRKKLQTEFEELLETEVFNIGQEIMNEIDEEA